MNRWIGLLFTFIDCTLSSPCSRISIFHIKSIGFIHPSVHPPIHLLSMNPPLNLCFFILITVPIALYYSLWICSVFSWGVESWTSNGCRNSLITLQLPQQWGGFRKGEKWEKGGTYMKGEGRWGSEGWMLWMRVGVAGGVRAGASLMAF